MLKVIWIARFRRGMPKDEAREHWRETHGALGAGVPGLARYVQSQVAGPLPPETDAPAFDGYSSGWYADDGAYRRSMASPEWAAIGADSHNVFDTAFFWGMSAFVDEHVLVAPEADAVKISSIVRFRPGGEERWVDDAQGALGGVPGLAGCVLNVAGDAVGVEGRDPGIALGFGGVAEYWFDDHTALVNALASRGWRVALDAAAAAVDAGASWWALMEERLILDVGAAGPRAAAARG
jgi:uncharacterized protein (TIGR02118 family)